MAELTNDQRKSVLLLLHEFEDQTKTQRERIMAQEEIIFHILDTTPIQQDKVDTALKAMADAQFAISQIALKKLIESKSFLLKEQQRPFYDAVFHGHPDPPMGPGHQKEIRPGDCEPESARQSSHKSEGKPSHPR